MNFSLVLYQSLSWSLFALGAYRLFVQEFLSRRFLSLKAPTWRASLLNTGLLIWALALTILGIQEISRLWLMPWALNSNAPLAWRSFAQCAPLHFAILALAGIKALLHHNWPLGQQARPHSTPLLSGFWSYCMALPLIWLTSHLWIGLLMLSAHLGFPSEAPPQPLVELIQETNEPWALVALAVLAIVIAPLSEECLFRAGLYRFLKQHIPQRLATGLTALLFALVHYNTLSFLPLFLLGILLSIAYESTGYIRTPYLFHALFNAQSFICILIDPAAIESFTARL